jgi:hypothetical protein
VMIHSVRYFLKPFCFVINRLIVVYRKFMCYLVKLKFSLIFQNQLKQECTVGLLKTTSLLLTILLLQILYCKCHIQKKPIYNTARNYNITNLVDIKFLWRNLGACVIAEL